MQRSRWKSPGAFASSLRQQAANSALALQPQHLDSCIAIDRVIKQLAIAYRDTKEAIISSRTATVDSRGGGEVTTAGQQQKSGRRRRNRRNRRNSNSNEGSNMTKGGKRNRRKSCSSAADGEDSSVKDKSGTQNLSRCCFQGDEKHNPRLDSWLVFKSLWTRQSCCIVY
jgi:hypothetical protein